MEAFGPLSLFRGFAAKPRATLGLIAFWSSSIFLMLDEKPHVFVGVHTRLINA